MNLGLSLLVTSFASAIAIPLSDESKSSVLYISHCFVLLLYQYNHNFYRGVSSPNFYYFADIGLRLQNNRDADNEHSLHLEDYINGRKINKDDEIPKGQDPVEDAMENGEGFQGDIDLTPEQASIIVKATGKDLISMRSSIKDKHWPRQGTYVYIPYTISGEYDENERSNIARAFEDFENNTCVR